VYLPRTGRAPIAVKCSVRGRAVVDFVMRRQTDKERVFATIKIRCDGRGSFETRLVRRKLDDHRTSGLIADDRKSYELVYHWERVCYLGNVLTLGGLPA